MCVCVASLTLINLIWIDSNRGQCLVDLKKLKPDLNDKWTHFRRLLLSFIVCGLLVYFLIIYYDQADIINNIGDHVETELVSDRWTDRFRTNTLNLYDHFTGTAKKVIRMNRFYLKSQFYTISSRQHRRAVIQIRRSMSRTNTNNFTFNCIIHAWLMWSTSVLLFLATFIQSGRR